MDSIWYLQYRLNASLWNLYCLHPGNTTVLRLDIALIPAALCYSSWACRLLHYSDVIMSSMASQITGVSVVYSTVSLSADQTNYESSASLAFVRRIHRWPVDSLHKGPVTRKRIRFDDVIMNISCSWQGVHKDTHCWKQARQWLSWLEW